MEKEDESEAGGAEVREMTLKRKMTRINGFWSARHTSMESMNGCNLKTRRISRNPNLLLLWFEIEKAYWISSMAFVEIVYKHRRALEDSSD
jgi:hypothetical protein